MTTFKNTHGLLCFTANKVGYILNKGDSAKLPPDDKIVKTYVALGYLVAEENKNSKNKN